jgi:hypothetical protein
MPHAEHNHPHHQDAAKHHEQAAKCHLEAAKLQESGKHGAAANLALAAHGHTLHALHHSDEAIKKHAEMQAPL